VDVWQESNLQRLRLGKEKKKHAVCGSLQIQEAKNRQKLPTGHHCTILSGYIFATKAHIGNREKTS